MYCNENKNIYEVGPHSSINLDQKSIKSVLLIFPVPCGPRIYLARDNGTWDEKSKSTALEYNTSKCPW